MLQCGGLLPSALGSGGFGFVLLGRGCRDGEADALCIDLWEGSQRHRRTPQATRDASGVFASEGAYITGVEKAYAMTGVGEDDYEGELSREKIEAELARRNVWRDVGEVGFGGFRIVGFGEIGWTDGRTLSSRFVHTRNAVLGPRPRRLHARGDPCAQVRPVLFYLTCRASIGLR